MRRATLVALLVALLAACGGEGGDQNREGSDPQDTSAVATSPPETAPPTSGSPQRQNIEIVKKGFSNLKPEYGEPLVSYGVLLRNPNQTTWVALANVQITFEDRSGQPLETVEESIHILPGEVMGIGDIVSDVKGAAKMEVQALASDWQEAEGPTGSFSASKIRTTRQEFGGLQTNGRLRSTFAEDQRDVRTVAIYYNRAGRIIGGAWTYVDFVPAGGTAGVSIDALETIPGVAKTEIYAEVGSQ